MRMAGQWARRGIVAATLLALAAPADAKPFTIAAIPDTQNYIDYTHQKAEGYPFDASELFLGQMRYIASRLESAGGDIAFVTALGDVWQHQTLDMDPTHKARGFKRVANPAMDAEFAPTPKVFSIELPKAREGYRLIAGKVPFSVVPGNHDYDSMWTDSNHPPKPEIKSIADVGVLHASGLTNFVSVFGAESEFFKDRPWYIASHDGGADSAQIFTAGGMRFLHIGLQFDPPDASLAWAATVIQAHPGLPTILSTHDYMSNEGERRPNPVIDNNAVDPQDNTPQMVWDKLISQHDQIFLVLCGHQHGQAFRTDPNRFGHAVYQILADYQDRAQTAKDAGLKVDPYTGGIGDGWLRLLTFDLDGPVPTVAVRTYSPHYRNYSADQAGYAAWYKAQEKPKLSDAEFLAQDEFTFDLADFRKRFPAAAKR